MTNLRPRVIIDGRLLAYRRGGIQSYVRGLLSYLPEVAPDLTCAVALNRPTDRLGVRSIRVVTPPHHRAERLTLGAELSLRRPALVHSPDFVHPWLWRSRSVVTIHDLAFLKYPGLLHPDAQRFYAQVGESARRASKVIAVSHATAHDIHTLLQVGLDHIEVIPNGISDEYFNGVIEREDDILERTLATAGSRAAMQGGDPILLAVGTVEPRKRYGLLLDALQGSALVRRDRCHLVIVGQPGWLDVDIRGRLRAAEAEGWLTWLQDVDNVQLRRLYQAAALLLFPSMDEGFGMPAAEAMASGLPVVAAARGALPEVVGDAGLLVESDRADDWAEAIQSVLDDTDRREAMRRRGRERASVFRWERAAAQTAAVYRMVINE